MQQRGYRNECLKNAYGYSLKIVLQIHGKKNILFSSVNYRLQIWIKVAVVSRILILYGNVILISIQCFESHINFHNFHNVKLLCIKM